MSGDAAVEFLRFALAAQVLRFGRFQTKAGRMSPYFFNAGLFNSGELLWRLGHFYAGAIVHSGIPFDMLFGPAYKGIPMATVTAAALAATHGRDVPIAYNRKEVKAHGEGGQLIGAPLGGRVLVIDDVISAGTSVRESAGWIREAGAELAGVVIALDRQERGSGQMGAVREVEEQLGAPVTAIARLADLIRMLEQEGTSPEALHAIRDYRQQYGEE